MTQHPSALALPVNPPRGAAVEAELERIVSSAEFRKSARMCRFLALVTRETLNGNAATLKEYRIGTEVFDRGESFDPRVDPIVRNEARRLRRKLEMYYLVEGKADPLVIELPKGGYIPVFSRRTAPPEPVTPEGSRQWRRLGFPAVVMAFILGGWWLVAPSRPSSRSARSTPAPAAEAYALGRHLLFNLRADDIGASRIQLETAIRLDPASAEAFAALALNYQASVIFGLISREAGMAKSRDLANKAAELSPEGAAGEMALGAHCGLLEEDYAQAARHLERALARDPNDAAAHAQYAVACLLQLGSLDRARREARRANQLDPQNALAVYARVLTDYCARDYPSAVAHANEALARQPDSEVIPPLLVDSYLAMGSFDEAWFFAEKVEADRDVYRALIRASRGQRDDALRLGRERSRTGRDPVLVARLFSAGRDATSAIASLERADRRHDFGARILARYAADFDALRSSGDFAALLAAMSKPRRE